MQISQQDRDRLRALAGKQTALAGSDAMRRLMADWKRHGAFDPASRPMVRIEVNTFENDILPGLMQCASEPARQIERTLLKNMVNHELFGDDTLVPDHYAVRRKAHFVPFGLPVRREGTDGIGHQFIPYLRDLDVDDAKLGPSIFSDDDDLSDTLETLTGLFGDLLPVRETGFSLYACPTQDIVHIMHMEDMFMAMYDAPERFEAMLSRLCDDYLAWYALQQANGHLHAAAAGEHLGQGTYCFTDELTEKSPATIADMWLYMDSQETSGVSPAMYEELVFPSYRKLLDTAGLVSYGCCEAVHPIWDTCLSTLPNLRKVSISPWCDERFMGERLKGRRTVYLRKPSPNFLGVGAVLDEDAVRAHIRETAVAARGCTLEFAQRDVYAIHNTPDKVRRYVELIRETVEADWR